KSYGDEEDKMNSNYADYQRYYEDYGEVPGNFSPIFEIRNITRSRNISGFDRTTAGIGKIEEIQTFDANGDIISEEKNNYKDISYTGEVFHQKTHAKVPITYDPFFYNINGILDLYNIDYESFTPFTSPNAKGNLTMVNTNAYYNKRYMNQIIDRKTYSSNEATYTTEFLEFDEVTGMPTKTKRTDVSTGETILTEKQYAYHLYSEMGPKSVNSGNKNLLMIPALEKITKDGNIISGYNTTYRKNYPVRYYSNGSYVTNNLTREWRPHKVFNFNGLSDPSQWREETEYTLFNQKGDKLETKYFGDRYTASIYGYDDRFVIAKVSDAKYTECAYSGAEDPIDGTRFGGEVSRDAATVLNTNATYVHTGVNSVRASQNQVAFEYRVKISDIDRNRKYVTKVWVYDNGNNNAELGYYFEGSTRGGGGSTSSSAPGGTLNLNGGGGLNLNPTPAPGPTTTTVIDGQTVNVTSGSIAKAGNWHLLSLTIEIPFSVSSSFELIVQAKNAGSAYAYYDDFRFHPINSSMKSFVYQPWTDLVEFVLDEENFYDRSEYNAIGHLHRTYRETLMGEKLLTEQTFNFARYSTGGTVEQEVEQQADPGIDPGNGQF
ncbi:MAG: hypothetical protein AAFP19_11355, partial [Bacteroidota bacterium]